MMAHIPVALLAVLLPPLLMLWFVQARGGPEREPMGRVTITHLLSYGTVAVPLAFLLSGDVSDQLFSTNERLSAGAGLIEEGTKFVFLLALAGGRLRAGTMYTGVVYGCAVALAFAAAENIVHGVYAYQHGILLEVAIVRGPLTALLHGAWGVSMGALASRGLRHDPFWLLAAWLFPAVLHGGFNLAVFTASGRDLASEEIAYDPVLYLPLVFFAASAGIALWLVRRCRYRPPRPLTIDSPIKPPATATPTTSSPSPLQSQRFCATCNSVTAHQQMRCLACGSEWRFTPVA